MTDSIEVQAARAAIAENNRLLRLDPDESPAVHVYHMLRALLPYCDANSVDFDAAVSDVRADIS